MLNAMIHSGAFSQRGLWRGRGSNGVSSRPISNAAKVMLATNDCTTLTGSGTKNTRLISVSATSMA